MGRMFSAGRGISRSALPYLRSNPNWLKITDDDVTDHIMRLAKKGLRPSQVCVVLRDTLGVAQASRLTGSKVVRLLKGKGLAPTIPEDLHSLIKKAINIRSHLERCRKDRDAKYRLILTESKIHRLARYYKKTRALPANWKFNCGIASAMVA